MVDKSTPTIPPQSSQAMNAILTSSIANSTKADNVYNSTPTAVDYSLPAHVSNSAPTILDNSAPYNIPAISTPANLNKPTPDNFSTPVNSAQFSTPAISTQAMLLYHSTPAIMYNSAPSIPYNSVPSVPYNANLAIPYPTSQYNAMPALPVHGNIQPSPNVTD